MLLFLQIALTILSALAVAAVIPLGAFLGWTWAIVCALLACLFYILMLLCKQARPHEQEQEKQSTQTPDEEKSKDE